MAEERLAYLFITVNVLYALFALALLFRYRPWRWVAVVKIAGFGLVLFFWLAATVVWLVSGLDAADVLVYTAWSLVFGWISAKLAREAVVQLIVIGTPDAGRWFEFKLELEREEPGTWLIKTVRKKAADEGPKKEPFPLKARDRQRK